MGVGVLQGLPSARMSRLNLYLRKTTGTHGRGGEGAVSGRELR